MRLIGNFENPPHKPVIFEDFLCGGLPTSPAAYISTTVTPTSTIRYSTLVAVNQKKYFPLVSL